MFIYIIYNRIYYYIIIILFNIQYTLYNILSCLICMLLMFLYFVFYCYYLIITLLCYYYFVLCCYRFIFNISNLLYLFYVSKSTKFCLFGKVQKFVGVLFSRKDRKSGYM